MLYMLAMVLVFLTTTLLHHMNIGFCVSFAFPWPHSLQVIITVTNLYMTVFVLLRNYISTYNIYKNTLYNPILIIIFSRLLKETGFFFRSSLMRCHVTFVLKTTNEEVKARN